MQLKDSVQISKEGMNYLRSQLKEMGIVSNPKVWEENCVRNHILNHADPFPNSSYQEIWNIYEQKSKDVDILDVEGQKKCLTDAYAELYKQIVDGYRNGTREKWILYEGSEEDFVGVEFGEGEFKTRYKKLTMEEEISALDKEFDKLAKNVQTSISSEKLLPPLITELKENHKRQLEDIMRGIERRDVAKTEQTESLAIRLKKAYEKIFGDNDLVRQFINARENFKRQYHF